MIEYSQGNLLEADAEALVNTVNTEGVMGKGIALQFKQAFPRMYDDYRRACKARMVRPGFMHVFQTGTLDSPRFVINFPTKRHWKAKTRVDDVESGLVDLVRVVNELGIKSIAVPPLGCGNGGLDWSDVQPRIERALSDLPGVRVLLYAPAGAPAPEAMPVRTDPPQMMPGRAVIVSLLDRYLQPGYRATLLEVQKLVYFQVVAGEPSTLKFIKHTYGPYAEALNHQLQRMEGHLLRGYGDRSQGAAIAPMAGAADAAHEFLWDRDETKTRVKRVGSLIEGFETPHSLELLATVHWVAAHNAAAAEEVERAMPLVKGWNQRKRNLFQEHHVKVAWSHLRTEGWIG